MRFPQILALLAVAAALVPAAALAATRYKGSIGGDRTQTLKFRVSDGKVRGFEAVVYATCFTGGMLTTVTIPPTRIRSGRFTRIYQPVKSSQTYVYVKGTISGARATGTISETGSCEFEKKKWTARRQ